MLNLLTPAFGARELTNILPDSLPGWDKVGVDIKYDSATLYDYIDGGAELYLSYGMKEVISRIYEKKNLGSLRIEIFDMNKAEDAYGVFSHTRISDEKEYGQGSQFFTGALIFWKDHYYITITADDDNDEIRQAIRSVASQIDTKITSTGNEPVILSYLPLDQLQQDTYIYFHHYIWQNSHYYIADDNFLDIEDNTQALLARYGDKYNRMNLLLILYPDTDKADIARRHFLDHFGISPNDDAIRISDNTWLGTMLKGCLLACIFNAKSKDTAIDFLKNVIYQYSENK
jgi:hypothetical protein